MPDKEETQPEPVQMTGVEAEEFGAKLRQEDNEKKRKEPLANRGKKRRRER